MKNITDTELINLMKLINLKLHEKFYETEDDDIYSSMMIDLINRMPTMNVKFFNCIEDINQELKSINDIDNFKKFYTEVNGNLQGSLFVQEEGCEIYFIENDDFKEFVDLILTNIDDENTILFNKYLIDNLFKDLLGGLNL